MIILAHDIFCDELQSRLEKQAFQAGSGKSYMFQILSKLLNVAFCKVLQSRLEKQAFQGNFN